MHPKIEDHSSERLLRSASMQAAGSLDARCVAVGNCGLQQKHCRFDMLPFSLCCRCHHSVDEPAIAQLGRQLRSAKLHSLTRPRTAPG
jgi:hypothetical protein